LSESIRDKLSSLKAKIIKSVPVYGHYRIEEDLREWDRSIRDESINSLKGAENGVESLLGFYVTKRDRDRIGFFDNYRRDIRLRRETIRTSAYGFWPRLSPIKIDENALKMILDTDEKVLSECESFSRYVQETLNKIRSTSNEKETTEELKEFDSSFINKIGRIDDLIGKRSMIIRSGKLEAS